MGCQASAYSVGKVQARAALPKNAHDARLVAQLASPCMKLASSPYLQSASSYQSRSAWADWVAGDVQALVSQCPAKDAELKKTGKLVVSASLESPQAAFALCPRGGKLHLTDRPYTEAKEMVVGFFIIEAADWEEAVRVASLRPAATLGETVRLGIEVHPIGFYE